MFVKKSFSILLRKFVLITFVVENTQSIVVIEIGQVSTSMTTPQTSM